MKNHMMTTEQMVSILAEAPVASFAVSAPEAVPYIVPVHFVYEDGKIYIHSRPAGKKMDILQQNTSVCLCAYHMDRLILDAHDNPCNTNTQYESVIVSGNALLVQSEEEKARILRAIVQKYTPHLSAKELPPAMVKRTAVIQIDVTEMTGKYYG